MVVAVTSLAVVFTKLRKQHPGGTEPAQQDDDQAAVQPDDMYLTALDENKEVDSNSPYEEISYYQLPNSSTQSEDYLVPVDSDDELPSGSAYKSNLKVQDSNLYENSDIIVYTPLQNKT